MLVLTVVCIWVMNSVVAVSRDEAIQELLVLRQQVEELRCAQPLTGIYQLQPSKPGDHSSRVSSWGLPMSDVAGAFEMSENLVSFMLSVSFWLFFCILTVVTISC